MAAASGTAALAASSAAGGRRLDAQSAAGTGLARPQQGASSWRIGAAPVDHRGLARHLGSAQVRGAAWPSVAYAASPQPLKHVAAHNRHGETAVSIEEQSSGNSKASQPHPAAEEDEDIATTNRTTLPIIDTEREPELLSTVKDGVKAVKEAVVEEAAIVVDAVEKGVEVAAQTVSSVGELPREQELQPEDRQQALTTVAIWVTSALIFGCGIGYTEGPSKASEFFAGYLLEQSLSVDNLLVFVLIFNYFKVPLAFQGRVLTYGLAGAVVFRGIMIGLGVATIEAFAAINLVFAGILLFSSYKLLADSDDGDEDLSNNTLVKLCQRFIPVTSSYDGNKFYTIVDGVQKATPLLLTLSVVELSDLVFAVDSIPAVFGVTRDPFIVFSSNIFAILGLRSLYLLVSTSMGELHYLQPSVALVLGFIGSKMVADFFGFGVSTEVSLAVVASVLGAGVFLSFRYPKEDDLSKDE